MKKEHAATTNYLFRAIASTLTRLFINLASNHQSDDLYSKMHHFVQPGHSLRQPGASLRQPGVPLRQPGATVNHNV